MSWYKKTIESSARQDKVDQTNNLIDSLIDAQKSSMIDKSKSKDIAQKIIDRIDRKTDRILISEDVKILIKKIVKDAVDVILDSPQKFVIIIDEAIAILEDYLYKLEMKSM